MPKRLNFKHSFQRDKNFNFGLCGDSGVSLLFVTMSTRFKVAQCSSLVAILVCIVALSYDDLTGYHENNIHLKCGWNAICIRPTDNIHEKYDCIHYDDCESLNIRDGMSYNCDTHKSTGEIYLALSISCIILATLTLFIKKW